MSKEKFLHDRPYNGLEHNHTGQHSIRRAIDSAVTKLRDWRRGEEFVGGFAGTQEQRTLLFPDEGAVGGFENGIQHDVWLEQVRRTNTIYNQSISVTEDPRLKDD